MDIPKCRSCLASEKVLIHLDESFVNGYNLLTSLNIMLSDDISQYVCQDCINTVGSYLDFREKCFISESTLQKQRLQIKSEESTVKISNVISPEEISFLSKKKIRKKKCNKDKTVVDSVNGTEYNAAERNILNYIKTNIRIDLELKQQVKQETPDDTTYNGFCDSFCFEELPYFMKEEHENDDLRPIKLRRIRKDSRKSKDLVDQWSCLDSKPKKTRKTRKGRLKKIFMLETQEIDTKGVKHIENPFVTCGLCEEKFPKTDKEALSTHVESHRGGRCRLCPDTFASWPALQAHRAAHLTKQDKRCHVCNKYFYSAEIQEFHYMKMHENVAKPTLTCKKCPNPTHTFNSPLRLRKHMLSNHIERNLICDYCFKSFNNKQRLVSHIRIHSDNKDYVCQTCGFSCKFPGGLQQHIVRRHTPDKASCRVCARVFRDQAQRAAHACERAAVCAVCGLQLGAASLRRHLLTHNPEPKHKCDRCPATFRSRGGLKIHLNRHDGVRTYKCEYCPRAFYTGGTLIKHRRVHTGEKPYVCKVCGKGFTGNHNLKVHMKVHGEDLIVKRTSEEVSLVYPRHG